METVVVTAQRDHRGGLSMIYETGYRPGQEAQAAARVSTGRGDRGGVSYGAYQLSSTQGQVQRFLRNEGGPWASRFTGLDPTVRGGAFGGTWTAIAAENPTDFFNAQHAYIERTHYDPVVARVLNQTGVDINSLPSKMRFGRCQCSMAARQPWSLRRSRIFKGPSIRRTPIIAKL